MNAENLRFFGDDFAVFPNVNRRAVHAGRFARNFGRAAQSTADCVREFFAGLEFWFRFPFHSDLSSNFAVLPELSYTLQASAKRR